jgi:hypothetical protein
VTWWLAALLVSLILPAMAGSLPISPLWIANALAWNITRGDPLAGILAGTGTFLAVMLFVAGFSHWLERHIEQDHARRLSAARLHDGLTACTTTWASPSDCATRPAARRATMH